MWVGDCLTSSRSPRASDRPRATIPLGDLALDDRERVFYGSRAGDIALLGLLTAILLGNGLYIWHRLGPKNHATGSAIFWGLALLCALWALVVYTFKLSVSVRLDPHGVTISRGPWRTELAWAHVGRLVERMQVDGGQRRRWVVALARDGRQLQVREDMVSDYHAFRMELYERYRLWRDHGGTWGTTGGGPYHATETSSTQTRWLCVLAAFVGLPGLYLWTQIHGGRLVGGLLIALSLACVGLGVRAVLRRQTYLVDPKAIVARQLGRSSHLAWRDVARVERTRIAFSGLVRVGILLGRLALRVASRRDSRVQSFDWYPRIPEYLILRGAGRQVRVRLHKLARPDEMLAWVEFYERQGRRRTDSSGLRKSSAPVASARATTPPARDFSVAGGPTDPWGAGQQGAGQDENSAAETPAGAFDAESEATGSSARSGPEDNAAWLSADASNVRSSGQSPRPPTPKPSRDDQLVVSDANWSRPQTDFVTDPPAPNGAQSAPIAPSWSDDMQGYAQPTPDQWTPQATADWRPGAHEDAEPVWSAHDVARWASAPEQPQPALTPEARPAADDWQDDFLAGEADDDAPTASVETLASAFAPWRDESEWQRPLFPRYGPPSDESQDD